jgi:hypothetical protein
MNKNCLVTKEQEQKDLKELYYLNAYGIHLKSDGTYYYSRKMRKN